MEASRLCITLPVQRDDKKSGPVIEQKRCGLATSQRTNISLRLLRGAPPDALSRSAIVNLLLQDKVARASFLVP
jgi:hypothetical protein